VRAWLVSLGVTFAGLALLPSVFGETSTGSGHIAAGRGVVTYAQVAPIFESKCVTCHTVGGVAPFPLATAADARSHADLIALMAKAGLMPPWPPARDSQPFVGQARRLLTPDEKALIAGWVADGARTGTTAPAPKPVPGLKGIVLRPGGAYLPHPSVGLDDYHCTLLDPKLPYGGMVTAARVVPGAPSIVHHVILFEITGAAVQQARAMNANSGGHGWTCFGGPGVGEGSLDHDHWLGVWVPGKTNDAFPAGTGMSFPKGAAIVMQVHYNLIHRARPDRTQVVLRFAPKGTHVKPLETKLFPAPVELPCPAGSKGPLCSRNAVIAQLTKKYGFASAQTTEGLLWLCHKTLARAVGTTASCDRRLDSATMIYAVGGHMHLRGVDIRIELNPGRPDALTLLHIPHWSFHWQDIYTLQKPIQAPAGTVVRVTCRYNNSQATQPIIDGKQLAPRYVVWGEGTTDEMCLGILETSVTTPGR
jgi:mono/diheme cytochrome c family protein